MTGGIVSARFPPTSRMVSACGNVLEGKRQPAIETESLRRSSRSRRHAESAVVVDVRRAQRDTRELSEQIRFLVGQRPSTEHANRVAAVGRLRRSNRRCDPIDRALPRRGIECACRISHERREQPLGVANRLGGGPSLEAQPTFIDGKSLVTFDLDAIAVAGDVHAALKRAIRTMSRDSGRDWIHPCPPPQQGACPAYRAAMAPRVCACRFRNVHECRSRMTLSTNTNANMRDPIDEALPAARRSALSKNKSTQSLPAKSPMNISV